jgi:uncharacterized protein (TIGR00251 family)
LAKAGKIAVIPAKAGIQKGVWIMPSLRPKTLQSADHKSTEKTTMAAENTNTWLRRHGSAATLALHVQPGARKTEVAGLHGDALKIRLAAPPVDGKANAALIEFVADRLGLPKSAVRLASGQNSRRKTLELAVAPPDAEQRLLR